MPLSLKAKEELLDTVRRLHQELGMARQSLVEFKRLYDLYGPEVVAFLEQFFTQDEWVTAKSTIEGYTDLLEARIRNVEGAGLL